MITRRVARVWQPVGGLREYETYMLAASRRFRVFVDLGRLRANLARVDGREATDDHARAFLADAGFEKLRTIPAPNAYLADEHALAHLEPDEVRSVHQLDEVAESDGGSGASYESARQVREHRKFSVTPYAAG